ALRELRDQVLLQLEARVGAAQVIALGDLAIGLIHGIGKLMRVDLGDGIEIRHGRQNTLACKHPRAASFQPGGRGLSTTLPTLISVRPTFSTSTVPDPI